LSDTGGVGDFAGADAALAAAGFAGGTGGFAGGGGGGGVEEPNPKNFFILV
jgi:hypothetical protein